ncbi:MAG: tannase/feruloyl esterase family alpha/beta hydrolase [Verrucomicrobiae bacterium]|nr:tannase/feruloyl esterase family alpha/beta hydrolase [Verrucomicrobiae bacterium]
MHTSFHPIFLSSCLVMVGSATAQSVSPLPTVSSPKPLYTNADPILSPEDLYKVKLENTTIDSVEINPEDGSCRVTATVNHPPANDQVKVFIALPMKGWNGRFRGNGGGGFVGGSPRSLVGPVRQGWATGATDTGHEGGSGSFGLSEKGQLNWQDIRDNAYLGIHAMTVVGKALTEAFYGKPPRYSYFVGNSTGGRQGLSEAQRYPEDYDGILSGCPAINWHRFLPADLWPQAVMNDAGNYVSQEKFDGASAAATAACDGNDGVLDGIVDDPMECTWDPEELVGTKIGDSIFTENDADVLRQIWQGARGHDGRFLWYGMTRGTNLSDVAGTEGTPLRGKPFRIPLDWFRYFLVQDPDWDSSTMTKNEFELLWNQSFEQYGAVFGTDNPDLSRFRDSGGKVIITHGWLDHQIPTMGSVDYYRRVLKEMGGVEKTQEFARLFLMPGLNHGFRGDAPAATQDRLLEAIINWVEEGRAPEILLGEQRDNDGNLIRTRPWYPYPQVARYKGRGNSDDAANFSAVTPIER